MGSPWRVLIPDIIRTLLIIGRVVVRTALLVATDGLYDMMSNDCAVEMAFGHWGDPAAAAEHLVSESGNPIRFDALYLEV